MRYGSTFEVNPEVAVLYAAKAKLVKAEAERRQRRIQISAEERRNERDN